MLTYDFFVLTSAGVDIVLTADADGSESVIAHHGPGEVKMESEAFDGGATVTLVYRIDRQRPLIPHPPKKRCRSCSSLRGFGCLKLLTTGKIKWHLAMRTFGAPSRSSTSSPSTRRFLATSTLLTRYLVVCGSLSHSSTSATRVAEPVARRL